MGLLVVAKSMVVVAARICREISAARFIVFARSVGTALRERVQGVRRGFDLVLLLVYFEATSEYADVSEAKPRLSHWVEDVQAGREVVICRRSVPVAKLISITVPRKPRHIGLAKGTFSVPPEFFDPLPDDLVAAFGGL